MSTAISPPVRDLEPASISERDLLKLCGLKTLRQLRNGIACGRIPRPDLVPSRNLLRWRESTIRRWLAEQATTNQRQARTRGRRARRAAPATGR